MIAPCMSQFNLSKINVTEFAKLADVSRKTIYKYILQKHKQSRQGQQYTLPFLFLQIKETVKVISVLGLGSPVILTSSRGKQKIPHKNKNKKDEKGE